MSEILETFEELNLRTMEYGHLLEDTYHGASSFRINIPKIMGLIGMGLPTSWSVPVTDGIIANAPDCAVSVSGMTGKNFLTTNRQPDRSFKDLSRPDTMLPKGTKFQVMIMDNDHHKRSINSTLR